MKGTEIFLISERRVSEKGHMFLKHRNRQKRLTIWPSMFMFNGIFPSITGFRFSFRRQNDEKFRTALWHWH